MRLLVTGASGFVGRHLVPRALGRGHAVRVLLLPDEPSPFEGLPVDTVRGDITRPLSLVAAVEGIEAVLHLAAWLGDGGLGPYTEFFRVNVLGLHHLLHEARRARVGRFVQVSSISAVGVRVMGREVDESAGRGLTGEGYTDSKAVAEWLVERSGLPAVILRPAAVVGEGDRTLLPTFARYLAHGHFRFVRGGHGVWSLIHPDDLADALLLAAEHPDAPGGIFNVTSGEAVPFRDLVVAVARGLGLPPPAAEVPFWRAAALGLLPAPLQRRLWDGLPVRLGHVVPLRFSLHASDRRIRQRLGFRPRVGWQDAVARAAAAHLRAAPPPSPDRLPDAPPNVAASPR